MDTEYAHTAALPNAQVASARRGEERGIEHEGAGVMLIGELAGRLGISPKTIRYYEDIELVPRPARSEGGYRLYGDENLARLRFIKTAQRLGMALDEIREILAFRDRGEAPCGFVREVLARQTRAIDERIAQLSALRDELVHLNHQATRLPHPEDEYCPLIHVAEPSRPRDGQGG